MAWGFISLRVPLKYTHFIEDRFVVLSVPGKF